ncbi:MAG TPA: FMN-binding negative transcriptional regulator [Ktedonobacteraceae bacterium]|nr:FMN-binding negative transcriptional regulator [Ktedonobacteraceae bacterium]
MYIPKAFREEDIDVLHAFMQENNFAILVTIQDSVPLATHLPLILGLEKGAYGTLRGYMARANMQWRTFDETKETLVIFPGPHAYISPSWYVSEPETSVPTWNYAAIHAYGIPHIVSDEDALYTLLKDSVDTFEAGFSQPWTIQQRGDFMRKKMRAIVGFELLITRLEGKLKLSQNRSSEDRESVVAMLQNSDDMLNNAIAKLMQDRIP